MSQPPITCHVNDALNVAAQRMWDHDCGAVAVINDDGKLAGMITDRDICMAALMQGRSLDQLLVNSAMSKHVVSARPAQLIGEIEQLMAKHQLHRIPIVDAENRPIGVVSLNNLAIEATQPDSRMRQGLATIASTLAAISRPRTASEPAAAPSRAMRVKGTSPTAAS